MPNDLTERLARHIRDRVRDLPLWDALDVMEELQEAVEADIGALKDDLRRVGEDVD